MRTIIHKIKALCEIFGVALKLGLTSFGGPIAHLGYFHHEYVQKRKWLDEHSYGDLVALAQFLPGPASSQVGIGIGLMRRGVLGGLVAWLGFTLPSVLFLILCAYLFTDYELNTAGWIHGLKIVAVAIVAQAIINMGRSLTPDRGRITIAIVVACLSLLLPSSITQIALMICAGIIGILMFKGEGNKHLIEESKRTADQNTFVLNKKVAMGFLITFLLLLVILPIIRPFTSSTLFAMFDSYYRAGSLVFGGGHVVLPLLERAVVPIGWVSQDQFLAGYGLAQAVPGPLFTFASYLGAIGGGIIGAVIATIAIFLPSFLLIAGTLPFWQVMRKQPKINGAVKGVNAAVVGILLAAFYNPIWTTAIQSATDFTLALILFTLLFFWKSPPWVIVCLGVIGGLLISL